MKRDKKKPVVFLVCTGLGRVNRGYESFTRECFDNLKDNTSFDLFLIKGGGKKTNKEIVLFNLYRNSTAALLLARLFRKNAYYLEQASFLLLLLPLIMIKKPSLIYYSDFAIGSFLWHIRKRLKFSYNLLFVNGAPNGPPYKTEDHVQQLLPVYYNIGIKSDGTNCKHTLLPYAFDIDKEQRVSAISKKEQVRKKLGLCEKQKIVLTVGAVNSRHKRMDYVINELAGSNENYFLIIIGQFDDETPALMRMAAEKLPGRNMIKNVPYKEVEDYYIAADYFVLASLQEGFPRVTIEALSYGLPCLIHDYIINRQVLKQHGSFLDMRFDGELTNCLRNFNASDFPRDELIQTAYNNYSWDSLKTKYTAMISKQITANN